MPRCRSRRRTRTRTPGHSSPGSTTCGTNRAAAGSSSATSTDRSTSSTNRRRHSRSISTSTASPADSGLFPKFTYARNFATGLINVILDPDYARNGVFYTLHMEDPSTPGAAAPRSGVVPGLDLSGYTTTPAVATPTVGNRIDREVVLVEWRDRNIANTTFEGTARELLRVQHPVAPHPLGEMTFNPAARPGDPDWRVMYLGAGDAQSGEQRDSRRLNPQRLDTLVGKILRIVPDLREHTNTSTVSENGRYRIPNDNPFVDDRRRAQGDLGLRPAQSPSARLGHRSWQAAHADAAGLRYRARRLGDGRRHPQGGKLRIPAA